MAGLGKPVAKLDVSSKFTQTQAMVRPEDVEFRQVVAKVLYIFRQEPTLPRIHVQARGYFVIRLMG